MSRQQLQPKSIINLHLGAPPQPSSSRPKFVDPPPPVTDIQVPLDGAISCDSSCSSHEEAVHKMHAPLHLRGNDVARRRPSREGPVLSEGDDWVRLLGTAGPHHDPASELQRTLAKSSLAASSPHKSQPSSIVTTSPASKASAAQPMPKPILRRRLSSSSLSSHTHAEHQRRQQRELQSIRQTLEDMQHNFVTNDNSVHSSNPQSGGDSTNPRRKEFAIRHFPNGDLFSGNVDAETGELIYGRMTCALEMEVYEGPFKGGRRHGEGAVCAKMDGGAKFLGRYHEGQMHSGTLIVTRNLPTDFTYTGTFLGNDFHGVGTIVSHNGSIYQGQFSHGVYSGVGTLRTVEEEGDGRGEGGNGKMESVYTGDFSEGLFHGTGTLSHSDGSSFAGSWREGKRVDGTETYPNGDTFEGRFVNDRREGQGVWTCGKVSKRGVWEGDVLKEDSELEMTLEGGHVYTGEHANAVPHGFGMMEYADTGSGRASYTGWFVNGVRHGEGRCFFHATGEEYEGEWAFDEPVGLKLFQHDGPLVDGSGGCVLSALDEGEDAVETTQCPTTLLGQLRDASIDDRRSRRRSTNGELNSSLVSRASTGECSIHTQESIALSSIDDRTQSPTTVPRGRTSSQASCLVVRAGGKAESSDDLSLSMKSFAVFDCTEGLQLYRYQNGDVFKGTRLDKKTNRRQGSGIYTEHRMGSVYNGDWKESKRHGVGHLRLASGVEYSGEFFEDRIHGQGSLTLVDGSVYTGSFFNGLFHGRGMLESEGKSRVFFGEFENGERSGEGDETFLDGSRYKGEYRQGKRNGPGTLFDPNGSEIYTGNWMDDKRHGKGKLLRHQREGHDGLYDGDHFQNKISGYGKATYADGTSIEGQWLDDVPRDGDWSIEYPDGSKYYGFATFQHPEEKSVASDGSATRETGTKARDLRVPLPHGFGSLTYPSGRRFVGSFVYGECNDSVGKK